MNVITFILPVVRGMLARMSQAEKLGMMVRVYNLLGAIIDGDKELVTWMLDEMQASGEMRTIIFNDLWLADEAQNE